MQVGLRHVNWIVIHRTWPEPGRGLAVAAERSSCPMCRIELSNVAWLVLLLSLSSVTFFRQRVGEVWVHFTELTHESWVQLDPTPIILGVIRVSENCMVSDVKDWQSSPSRQMRIYMLTPIQRSSPSATTSSLTGPLDCLCSRDVEAWSCSMGKVR